MKRQILTIAMLLGIVVICNGIKTRKPSDCCDGQRCVLNQEMDMSGEVESEDDETVLHNAVADDARDEAEGNDEESGVTAGKKYKKKWKSGWHGSNKKRAEWQALKEQCPTEFESFKECIKKCAKGDRACKRACRQAFKEACAALSKDLTVSSQD